MPESPPSEETPALRPRTFDELVALIAQLPATTLADALAHQAVSMGALAPWPPEIIEYIGIHTSSALSQLGLPEFFGQESTDEEARRFWCSIDPVTSLEEWARTYGWSVPECEHKWEMWEGDYARMWDVTVGADGSVEARERGFSDHGSAVLMLECRLCGESKPVKGAVVYR